jgi:radical SAM superfamily enzyme YgiQ (UPF0313 family)
VDNVPETLLRRMSRAGCRSIFFGVEAGSQRVLDAMGKQVSVEQIEESVRLAKETIGWVNCGVVFGVPGETRESAEETIALIKKLEPMTVVFHMAIPMPGSPLFAKGVEQGLIDKSTVTWEDFDMMPKSHRLPVAAFSELSREELLEMTKRGHREFYFRPSYVLRLLKACHAAWAPRYIWLALKEVLSHQFANLSWSPQART